VAALLWRRLPRFGPGWLNVVSGRTTASLVTAGFRGQHVFRGHAFAEGGSPVCFVEMPLDNRTVVQFAAVAAIVGFFRLPDTSPSSKRLKVSSLLAVL